MSKIDLAYFNYINGGLIGGNSRGGGHGYDHTGLVRVMGEDDRWPDVFVMGEGNRYEFGGEEGMWDAVEKMHAAGGPAYTARTCSLPREWGPLAPVYFINPQKLMIHRFYDHRLPDFAARNRNVLILTDIASGQRLHLCATHGDPNDPGMRLADARLMRWLANDDIQSAILGDWNETLSGPHHELHDPAVSSHYNKPWQLHHRLRHEYGRPVEPYYQETAALDFLCGHWDYRVAQRRGGLGFVDVAEQSQLLTPTRVRTATERRDLTQIDHILLNAPLAEKVVEGSAQIHEPIDPEAPDSDHKRISVTIEL